MAAPLPRIWGMLLLTVLARLDIALGVSTRNIYQKSSSRITALDVQDTQGPTLLVPIELFVMSRCPDARRAEARFDEVLAVVHSIAQIRTIYIADEANNGSIVCKHGPIECAGDVQQLCAQRYGGQDPADGSNFGWSFLMCQNQRFNDVGSPELAATCLKTSLFPNHIADKVRSCWSGEEGAQLLQVSAAEARRRGAQRSCTIFVGGTYRCTHDGAQWYDCPGGPEVSDFVRTVCEEYKRLSGVWRSDICGPEGGAGDDDDK
ncbi:hypothetical protein VOLCADRAFT_108673 [Volvox carteri f. nagariensis]|uniref:Uncharacterized protein n=1 Tax=Volvox carteri f. nagariensis TaxID=3068 RepID=D8ULQ3_VOLCA|nr:uncharacterized protein VOLCADRAFT_108673 [Volvox carteri f. nagariensis]EFJ39347.1 hypothetical protein VOLCADRAFT_108673 [Volvox carteri f. nagariensis]|eukprot:XP_002959589.1 hypothetical protein VOLCADRAFT_108673 [Volvox carteri f. nagariensis]